VVDLVRADLEGQPRAVYLELLELRLHRSAIESECARARRRLDGHG
jgi:hypothetical protein